MSELQRYLVMSEIIFDNETRQLVIVFIILIKKMFRIEFNIK